MRRLILLILLGAAPALLGSCGPESGHHHADAADMAVPASLLAPCLDRPDELARPPSASLPCELIPPSF